MSEKIMSAFNGKNVSDLKRNMPMPIAQAHNINR